MHDADFACSLWIPSPIEAAVVAGKLHEKVGQSFEHGVYERVGP